jgi:2-pyrone-4,6-dicarboxylate lactonase
MDPNYLPFCPHPSKPGFKPPLGAVDAHCHVFGPGDVFPYHASRKYTPCDATKETLFARRDFLGFERNIIVQGSCHGPDNRALLDALAHSDGKARGVAVVNPDIDDAELQRMDEGGVRAVRFTFVPRLAEELPHEVYRQIAGRIARLGWHLVVYFEVHDLMRLTPLLTSIPTPVVIDHLAVPDISLQPENNPSFSALIDLVERDDRFVVKVTCPERCSRLGPPYNDFVPYGRRMIQAIPDRVLWGLDWPHPNIRTNVPDDGTLVDMIPRIAPSVAEQHHMLVDNPMRLYWAD